MYADSCVQIGIRRAHDGGGGPAGRQARDVDALRIDRMVPHDLAGDAGDQRGFAPAAALVARAKPVPALRLVGSARLFGIDHEAVLLFRQEVHPGAGGEIVRRLGTAVKHDDQRKRLSLRAARDEQLVGPASRRVAEGAFDEPCALGHDIRRGRRSAPDRTSQAEPGEVFHAVEPRGAFASLSGAGLRGLPAFALLDDVGLCVDGRRLKPRVRSRGGAARRRSWDALAAKHALQERGGLDQLACTREPGCFANCGLIQHRFTSSCRRERP